MTSPRSPISSVFLVCEKLRPPLANRVGNAGFRAILSRALTLASTDFPWMHGVYLTADLTLRGLDERAAQIDPADFAQGEILLVVRLLELLEAFIGENAMRRFILEVWPELSEDSAAV